MPIFPNSSKPKPQPLRITRFRGINLSEDPTQLANNESPDMLNMLLDSEGAPDKRPGFKEAIASLGAGSVVGIFQFGDEVLVAHGTKLYTFDYDVDIPWGSGTIIYSSMAGKLTKFFVMNEICYIQDGTNYLQYDGTLCQAVVPYIPTLKIDTPPAGGGTTLDQFNLLGAAFQQGFSGDATATVYQLALSGLDATAIVGSLDGGTTYDKVETTHFTVNRTTGAVTWLIAPSLGVDNVYIRAFKTVTGFADRIKKCTGFKIFGGNNDTRVFKWGSDFNTLYRSDVTRPNYFMENQNQKVGSNAERIMNMTVQYDTAVVEKERSKWGMTYSDDGTNVTFPTRPVNDTIGCYAAESVQIIENNPVALTRQGLYMLSGGTVRDERNVSHQSLRVDRRLLAEGNLANVISIDFDKKLYLAINGRVYIWDYLQPTYEDQLGEWYLWDSLPISCFAEIEGYLYFGTTAGEVMRLNKREDNDAFNDNGDVIEAYYMTKQFDLGIFELYKSVPRVFTTIKADINTSVKLYTLDGRGGSTLQGETSMSLFSYADFDYRFFTYLVTSFPQVLRSKIKLKKITHMQLKYVNAELHQSLKLLGISIEHDFGNYVK